ncbi:Vitamin B12-binding protein [bacterium HR10]|nr:Vitamin B12-binding protein [bacterium HR10]
MPRIVSLIASATEIICALGFEEHLVGRSHECDYPESVRRLPACTEPKFPVEGWSYEIDERVKAIVQEGLSVYRVHGERLRALRPDVIVTQSQCAVCAVSVNEVEEAVREWLDYPVRVVSVEPNALADVWESIRQVAQALGVPERGEELVATLRRRMAAIAETARALSPKPTVAYIEWIEPLMAGGNWMPELIEMAGGVNLFGEAGRHAPWLKWEDVVAKDPEVIVIAPCGFDIARTRREMPLLTRRREWPQLRAVREGRVIVADGNQFFNRPGPRLVESLEILAEALHPTIFRFGHEGGGWERWAE